MFHQMVAPIVDRDAFITETTQQRLLFHHVLDLLDCWIRPQARFGGLSSPQPRGGKSRRTTSKRSYRNLES